MYILSYFLRDSFLTKRLCSKGMHFSKAAVNTCGTCILPFSSCLNNTFWPTKDVEGPAVGVRWASGVWGEALLEGLGKNRRKCLAGPSETAELSPGVHTGGLELGG